MSQSIQVINPNRRLTGSFQSQQFQPLHFVCAYGFLGRWRGPCLEDAQQRPPRGKPRYSKKIITQNSASMGSKKIEKITYSLQHFLARLGYSQTAKSQLRL